MPDAPDLEIVAKPKEQKGFAGLPRRWVVERFFGWLGCCWRLAKDYERRLENSLEWLPLAVVRILIQRLGRAEALDKNQPC
jgi:putative transposase